MDRMIYLSMSGAKAALQRQDSLANNLANVSTNGFRAELTAFRAVPVRGDGASTRVFSLETTPGYSDEQGAINATGRSLDVAMTGKSWLAVQSLDGTEAYTRAGALAVNSEGVLTTLGGNAWKQTAASGGPIVGVAGDGNLGVLNSGSLEESNVDLTAELVSMITAQRDYQANAQTIKTMDQAMQTLVNLR